MKIIRTDLLHKDFPIKTVNLIERIDKPGTAQVSAT